MSKSPITNDVFDSRDLIEYKEELEQEILDAYIDFAENHNEYRDEETEELEIPESFDEIEFLEDEAFISTCEELIEEYEGIKDFCEELEQYSEDFEHGETIIHENYFTEYAEETARDCGEVGQNSHWIVIDWEATADNLKMDYTGVEYNGETYYIR